jgi:hypothetical protein
MNKHNKNSLLKRLNDYRVFYTALRELAGAQIEKYME